MQPSVSSTLALQSRFPNIKLGSTNFLSRQRQPMISHKIVVRSFRRPHFLDGMNITPLKDIRNRHRLSPIVHDYAVATPKLAGILFSTLRVT